MNPVHSTYEDVDCPTVRISKPSAEPSGPHAQPALACRPDGWLGAPATFGLALPDAAPTAATLYGPRGVWLDDQRLIVCDSGNHRVMIWTGGPQSDHAPADVVLGQDDWVSEGPREAGLHLPTGVIVAGGKLLVADAWHHRILVWNEVPVRSGTPPDYALGQPDLSSIAANRGGPPSLAALNWPYGLAAIGDQLWVADTGNRRVLVWNHLPEHDCPADFVLGQSSPSDRDENRGGAVAANSFRWAHDIAGNDRYVWVADAGNHRVLGWHMPVTQDRPADWVLGQADMQSSKEWPYASQSAAGLRFPYAVDVCDDVLAVADTANNRVLLYKCDCGCGIGFQPVSISNASTAKADTCSHRLKAYATAHRLEACATTSALDVIGQIDFAAAGENRWQSVRRDTLCWPYGLSFRGGRMAIADSGNNRVMIWDCRALFGDVIPNKSRG